jgi:hypothetical protein
MNEERIYGNWTGNEKGVKEDISKCIENVYGSRDWIGHQCRRKRGFGKDKLYCKQHSR